MTKKLTFTIGEKVIRFSVGEFNEQMDIDKLLKIDYSNLFAEILTFPLVVNRFGLLAADMDNQVKICKLNLSIFEAKLKNKIREEWFEKNKKKATVAEVEDQMTLDKKYKIKLTKYYTVLKEKEYIYTIYLSAKDKSNKLDKLSLSLRPGDMDEKIIQKQMNNIHFTIKNATIN